MALRGDRRINLAKPEPYTTMNDPRQFYEPDTSNSETVQVYHANMGEVQA